MSDRKYLYDFKGSGEIGVKRYMEFLEEQTSNVCPVCKSGEVSVNPEYVDLTPKKNQIELYCSRCHSDWTLSFEITDLLHVSRYQGDESVCELCGSYFLKEEIDLEFDQNEEVIYVCRGCVPKLAKYPLPPPTIGCTFCHHPLVSPKPDTGIGDNCIACAECARWFCDNCYDTEKTDKCEAHPAVIKN